MGCSGGASMGESAGASVGESVGASVGDWETGAAEHNNQLVDGITRAAVKHSEAKANKAKRSTKQL